MSVNSKSSPILVIGATGFLGMEICRQLTQHGKKIIGLVRSSSDPAKVEALHDLGIETVIGDIKDPGSLKKAFKGVGAVISTASSTFSRKEGDSIESVDNDGQLNVVQAAIDADVNQFIFISFIPFSQEFPLQTAKRRVEKKLKESNLNFTILQPGFFMEVWLSPAVGFDFPHSKATIYGEGKNKLSWISLKDVASFAVESLDNKSAVKSTFQLGGPDALSPLEVVKIFEEMMGNKFAIEQVPQEALQAQKNAATDSLTESFNALMVSYAEGNYVNMREILKIYPVKLTAVSDYVKQLSHSLQEEHS